LEGRAGVIETARALSALAHWTGLDNDKDLWFFVDISSETGALPLGEVRKYWMPESLEREDAKIKQAEERYKDLALSAAASVAERFAAGALFTISSIALLHGNRDSSVTAE
jgi:hypothetical protein